MRLAQGDVTSAAASIRDALERPLRVPSKERPPNSDLQRAPLLEAQVEIEIAAGDIIMTGTPSGVAATVAGDKLECEIEVVGKLTVTIGPPAK